jgi:hypothetical protein
MRSTGIEICEDCIGLVGASLDKAPHPGLGVIDLATKEIFLCERCGTFWERQPLGWGSLPLDCQSSANGIARNGADIGDGLLAPRLLGRGVVATTEPAPETPIDALEKMGRETDAILVRSRALIMKLQRLLATARQLRAAQAALLKEREKNRQVRWAGG